jgi:phenylalanyl-tRNA synthetase alpha chain
MAELSFSEKKTLLAINELGAGASIQQIREKAGLEKVEEASSAASWLQTKGLVQISEKITKFVSLGAEGKAFYENGLPERRALLLISKGSKTMKDLSDAMKGEIQIALGWLKRKGWIVIGKELLLTDAGKKALSEAGTDEWTIEKLSEGPVESSTLDANVISLLKSRQSVIEEKETVERSYSLTAEGKKVASSGLDMKEQVSQLTPELIQSGKWRDVELRRYDVNTFAPPTYPGKSHPLRQTIDEIREIFLQMGFTEIDGDFVESAFWDMDVLFVPQDHPAREMQDTFYLSNPKAMPVDDDVLVRKVKKIHETGGNTGSTGWGGTWSKEKAQRGMLRTHTTVETIRHLSQHAEPPVKAFMIGKVFRREAIDFKHLAEFHQIEGIVMEKKASLKMLLGMIREFYSRMGFKDVRFRPGYFPYTEPSMEIEVMLNGKWMELGGSGIFRPEVVAPFKIKYPVLAWGMGLERLAMLRLGLNDIRDLYISDMDWLRKAPIR